MEKYIKLSDVAKALKDLYNEPEYYHEGETFYAGICAVEDAIAELSTTDIDDHQCAEWLVINKGLFGSDYACSNCGTKALEGNRGHYDILTAYCSNCGYRLHKKEK